MIVIADNRIPQEAKKNLSKYAEVIWLETKGITYDAISGHPDIFFTPIDKHLVVAPNLPVSIVNRLDELEISYSFGENAVGDKYPKSAYYNAVVNEQYIIHNTKITDLKIMDLTPKQFPITVKQGYTRCNLQMLDDNHFITSDKSIYEKLYRLHLKGIFIQAKQIILPGFNHGFLGGCCGMNGKQLFTIGSIKHLKEEKEIRKMLVQSDIELIELYDGPLFDGGSILFLNGEG